MVMKIKNLGIKTIEARRFIKDFSRPMNIRIDHNSSVTSFSYKGDNEAHVEFEYVASYGAVGVIKFEGEFIFESDKAKEVAERWQSKKNMPNEVASQIHTAIMHYCVPEAVIIARELKLPPPIPLPQIKFDKGGIKGSNKFGPEVA
ncbi:MAG: hypothetical protein DRN29_00820 [Thermoplasmata archaeon]|nr:MAG: hypothetical protein DRN29_00820 [Thermoplasmata archaeon]